MMKSDVQEKSRGVVLFAFNTEIFDYVEIAKRATRIIHHTLNLPVTIITDTKLPDNDLFDNIVIVDNTMPNVRTREGTTWRNGDRYKAYELSPYDETILIDSDYLILDTNILTILAQDFDYKLAASNQTQIGDWPDKMGPYGLEYHWATVVLFKKTPTAKMFFELVGRIQRNYLYYWNLYHVKHGCFRNDFAFTIANNILNGYIQNPNTLIPYPMFTYNDPISSLSLKNNLIVIKEKEKAVLVPKQNIHVMDKNYLLTKNFNDFVDLICEN